MFDVAALEASWIGAACGRALKSEDNAVEDGPAAVLWPRASLRY